MTEAMVEIEEAEAEGVEVKEAAEAVNREGSLKTGEIRRATSSSSTETTKSSSSM